MQAQTFTQHVQKQNAGEGRVVIVQSAEIDRVVNTNTRPAKVETAPATTPADRNAEQRAAAVKEEVERNNMRQDRADQASSAYMAGARSRFKTQGYRVQIFTGSNSHEDKVKAHEIGQKCQHLFPELSIYARFVSPRWICRVGDFRTYQDAQEYASKIRRARIATEVRIVKCEVLLAK